MIEAILAGLARANLAAAAAILLVLLVRKPARQLFGARVAYGLWLIPVLAVLAVFAPHPVAPLPSAPALIAPIADTATEMADVVTAEAPRAMSVVPNLMTVLFGLWLLGLLAATALLLRRQSRFVASLGKLEPVPDASPRRLRAEHSGVGPAVVGAFRPRIVTPSDFETRFAPAERDVVLAHEAVHLANGDARINALAAALQCLAWFNPLVHLGVRALRIDQELACDAAVLGRFPAARRLYAEVLLKTQLATQPLPLGCHWPAGAAHPLKERIVMLKSPLPGRSRRVAGALAVAALSLGSAAAAWAAQGGPGALERMEAERQLAAHPDYTCDPAGENRMEGCKIVSMSAWLALPTTEDVRRYYPAQAHAAGETAAVEISCKTTPTGVLKDCAVQGVHVHDPHNQPVSDATKDAFGKAALQLARFYQARITPLPGASPKAGFTHFPVFISDSHAAGPTLDGPAAELAEGPGLEPAEAAKRVGPGQTIDCKPDANRELHNCHIKGSPFAAIATAADVAREWPTAAKAAGLSGWVTLQCTPNLKSGRLDACTGYHYGGAAERPDLKGAFETAAVRVAAAYRLKTNPGPDDFVMRERPGFYTIEFNDHPSLPGGTPIQPPTRFPDFLPGPPKLAKAAAAEAPVVRTSISYAPPAEAAPAQPQPITQPIWIRKPAPEDFVRRYPAAAAEKGLSGQVLMTCAIAADGRLADCKVGPTDLSGDIAPSRADGAAFVDATLKLMGLFQMEPKTRDGQDVAGRTIRIPVRWSPPEPPAQP